MPTAVRSFCTKGHGLQCLPGFICLIQPPTGQAPSASSTHLTGVWSCNVHVFHGSFVVLGPNMVISYLVSIKGPHLHGGAEHYRARAAQRCWNRGVADDFSLQVLKSPQKYIGSRVVGKTSLYLTPLALWQAPMLWNHRYKAGLALPCSSGCPGEWSMSYSCKADSLLLWSTY